MVLGDRQLKRDIEEMRKAQTKEAAQKFKSGLLIFVAALIAFALHAKFKIGVVGMGLIVGGALAWVVARNSK